jgi:uncharacterized protein
MYIVDIIWLEEIEEKLIVKHNVEVEEVESVLFSDSKFRFSRKGIRKGEDVYHALGRTDAGRYLIDMNTRERSLYDRK